MGTTSLGITWETLRPRFGLRPQDLPDWTPIAGTCQLRPEFRWFLNVRRVLRLRHPAAFIELLDLLHGLSCRDQEDEPLGDRKASPRQIEIERKEMMRRRAEGHRLAKIMRDNAVSILKSIDNIGFARAAFQETVAWHPTLLEEIFDVDLGGPEEICLPQRIHIVDGFFGGVDWDRLELNLKAMAEIPVVDQPKRGPVANRTLRLGLMACRDYWRDVEGKPWVMIGLKDNEVRRENKRHALRGECEIFAACILDVCGINYTVQELSSAWKAIGAAAADARASGN